MFVIISILVLFFAVYLFYARAYNARVRKENESNEVRYKKPLLPDFSRMKPFLLIALAVFIFSLEGMFFWADAGTAYSIQYPWGGDKMVKTQGLKLKFWGRVIQFPMK